MSIHKSLKLGGLHAKSRNVLSRAERILALRKDGRWTEDTTSIFGLPKVRTYVMKKKAKAKKEVAAVPGADGAAAPAAGAAPAAAGAAKGAAAGAAKGAAAGAAKGPAAGAAKGAEKKAAAKK